MWGRVWGIVGYVREKEESRRARALDCRGCREVSRHSTHPPTPKPSSARHSTSCEYTSWEKLLGCTAAVPQQPAAFSSPATRTPAAALALPRQPRMMSSVVSTKHHLRPRTSPAKPKASCPVMLPMSAALLTEFLSAVVCSW